MEKSDRTRRRFIKGLIFAGASVAALWRFLVPARKPEPEVLLEVDKADIPRGGALVYQRSRIVVIRRHEDVYALSLVCTHLGCTVNVTPDRLVCPCHGSVFDRDGKVLEGPSNRPLERLRIEDRGATLVILA